MAYHFAEKRRTVAIEIEDHAWEVPYTTEMLQRFDQVGRELIEYAKSPAIEKDTPEDMALFVYDRIDRILGEGASDKIFAGRDPDYLEAADVMNYIINEMDAATKNRSQRRAENKPKKNGKRRYHGAYQ